uniref:Uncharacterized protein n=1 Tax=Anguilla anguilla TaxID=7936 RepID=A0A0E9VK56_ANGAN
MFLSIRRIFGNDEEDGGACLTRATGLSSRSPW